MLIRTCLRLSLLLMACTVVQAAEPAAKQFLRHIYGADGIVLADICYPSDDLWMLRGVKNPEALAALDELKFDSRPTGITSGVVRMDLYFIETRDGKVDPAFNLDGVYHIQRQLVQYFIYYVLAGNQQKLEGLVTDASKVEIVGPRAMPGEMGQYSSIIGMMPVVRSSKPANDAKTRTFTYRVPIGEEALSLTLVKNGNTWKIDTSSKVRVPLEFFFRSH